MLVLLGVFGVFCSLVARNLGHVGASSWTFNSHGCLHSGLHGAILAGFVGFDLGFIRVYKVCSVI